METNKKELISLYLKDNLFWDKIKIMDKKTYESFIIDFFTWLNKLRDEENIKYEIIDIISEININVSSENMGNSFFENRLGLIFDELQCFCPSPFFWDTELVNYLEKWRNYLQIID